MTWWQIRDSQSGVLDDSSTPQRLEGPSSSSRSAVVSSIWSSIASVQLSTFEKVFLQDLNRRPYATFVTKRLEPFLTLICTWVTLALRKRWRLSGRWGDDGGSLKKYLGKGRKLNTCYTYPYTTSSSWTKLFVWNCFTLKMRLRFYEHGEPLGQRHRYTSHKTKYWRDIVNKFMEILGARCVMWSMFHTEDPQILSATAQSLVATAKWRPEFVLLF